MTLWWERVGKPRVRLCLCKKVHVVTESRAQHEHGHSSSQFRSSHWKGPDAPRERRVEHNVLLLCVLVRVIFSKKKKKKKKVMERDMESLVATELASRFCFVL
jgi:hypothetical protein